MATPWVYFFGNGQAEGDPQRTDLLGGKGASLAAMTRAGLPVPPGFVISAECCRLFLEGNRRWPDGLIEEIRQNLARLEAAAGRRFGDGRIPLLVSVRSGAAVSMPGMMDTILNCGLSPAVREEHRHLVAQRTGRPFPDDPWEALLACIESVFLSWNNQRAVAYRREHGIEGLHGTAVTVQEMFPAEVAGVVFTRNPNQPQAEEMIIESSYGLGEAVVSGEVRPDQFLVDRRSLAVRHSAIGQKSQVVAAFGAALSRDADAPSLSDSEIQALCALALRVEDHFGCPVDVEWGLAGGRLALLQARPIRRGQAERIEQLIEATRGDLRQRLEAGRGPWVLHNLSETLPHPTPLSWSVQQRFLSGEGGFGQLYRLAGFEPSDRVRQEGFLDLIAGRIYMDLGRGPEMFFAGYPFRYDVPLLRCDPEAAQSPPTIPTGTWRQRIRLCRRIATAKGRLHETARQLDNTLLQQVFPEFAAWCRAQKQRDLPALSSAELVQLWRDREHRVLELFAPQSLLPSMISGMALDELRAFLREHFWDAEENPDELSSLLAVAEVPDKTLQANADLFAVARGRLALEGWLAEYGHRGPEELDLASPRWQQQPAEAAAMAERLKAGADPLERHHERLANVSQRAAELRAGLSADDGEEFDRRVGLVRRYVRFREDGKHCLMLGYDLLRDLALECGRRLGLGDDVFYLEIEELLQAVPTGIVPHERIAERKAIHRAELRIAVPRVIDRDSIATLGSPPAAEAADRYPAFGLSAGVATGPVRIVTSPQQAGQLGQGYVLVCRSTDPAWTPLFVNAAGLILECGGALSHGAVVAREMGIPAVVLPEATTRLREGEMVTVDGRGEAVSRLGDDARLTSGGPPSADDMRIGWRMIPPPPGAREHKGARWCKIALAFWGAYLLAVLLLPPRLAYQHALEGFDRLLWPFVPLLGKPGTVAVAAVGLAALTMLGQRLLTDNRRLREAKRRAAMLLGEAARLPENSPRRAAVQRLAAPVPLRTLAAALLPLSLLLGPMVMMFLWFPARVDPASWNAPPGASVSVVAFVDADFRGPVTLSLFEPLYLDESTPQSRTLLPIRETLEELLAASGRSGAPSLPAEFPDLSDWTPEQAVEDLRWYLQQGVPPRPILWKVRTPDETEGRFPVTARAGDQVLQCWIVLGDLYPPEPREKMADAGMSVQSLKIVYPPPEQKRIFWAPLAPLGKPHWDAGWLLLYLIVYLPAMFLFRWILRVA